MTTQAKAFSSLKLHYLRRICSRTELCKHQATSQNAVKFSTGNIYGIALKITLLKKRMLI